MEVTLSSQKRFRSSNFQFEVSKLLGTVASCVPFLSAEKLMRLCLLGDWAAGPLPPEQGGSQEICLHPALPGWKPSHENSGLLRSISDGMCVHACACSCAQSCTTVCVTPWNGKCRTSWWKISLIHPGKIKSKPLRASHDKLFPPSWLSEWPPLLAKPPQSHLLDSQQASELERNFIACITT